MSPITLEAPTAGATAFRPRYPRPRASRPALPLYLYLMWRNPIETWTEQHYELPYLVDKSPLGHAIVLNDPAAVRHVLLDNAANYEKDPLQLRILKSGAGEGLLVARGELWKRTRRTLAPLFTPKRIASFAPRMHAIAEAHVERWLKRRDGAIAEIDREMVGMTFDILSATLFSDALAADARTIERAMADYIEAIGRIDPLDILGAPAWLPRFGRRKARDAIAFFQAKVDELAADRRKLIERGEAPPDDLLTALIQARDPETGDGLSEEEIAANIITFIGAGHETTARALGWTLHLLSRDAASRAAVEREVDAAPTTTGLLADALPMTRACFEEAMRLFPPAPFMSRMALAADRIGEVEIPERSLVIVAPWLLHRHRRLWHDPDAFRPERFLPGARDAIDRFAYIPFGAGPRVCIGARFALEEALAVLRAVARRVRLTPVEAEEPRPLHRITLRPATRLTMHIHRRAPRAANAVAPGAAAE